jgi:UDP-N-acetylglucosamine--N-acetylmuramyl-(pentapeptide) pyrophosphoryl-undecaprenol N-acetylglucosamine transferase
MTVVLCGGGTAGHVIPAIALLPQLKKYFDNIVFMGGQGIEKDIAKKYSLEFYGVASAKLRRKFAVTNLAIPFRVTKGIFEARKILKKIKPSVVFSKGGYAALPVVIAARTLNIPVVAHESDLSPGISNKISSRFCAAVCTSFESCAAKFRNGIYTGSPIREELYSGDKRKIFSRYGIDADKPVLLVMGGSSGAKYINGILRECLDEILNEFNVIHITGKGNLAQGRKGYIQIEYTNDMADIFAAADFVVSRAGSNTLFEIVCLRKPAFIIPLPKGASRGDQIENAEYFRDKGCIMFVEQKNIDKSTFPVYIENLVKEKDRLINNMSRLEKAKGNENIMKVILKILPPKHRNK